MALEPQWVRLARADLGLQEIPGKDTHPKIRQWLIDLGAWWRDDETAWCGVAAGHWIRSCGYRVPRSPWRARAWLDWGLEIDEPCIGAVAIYSRKGGGHVNFLVGQTPDGRLLGIGGNQGNRVSIAAFDPARLIGLRWPREAAMLVSLTLPSLSWGGSTSTGEA